MTDQRTVPVTGATGRVGRHVVDGLRTTGVSVRALVRSPVTAGLPADVEIVRGDLRQPDTVAAAARGADAALLVWPSFAADGAAEVVAALAASADHLVYLSAARLQHDEEGPMPGGYADVEALIERSGASWTFVRAGGFAANTLEWAGQARAGDTVAVPFPAAARSLVDERDIADVVVAALTEPGHRGRAYAVTGPEVLSVAEQVAAVGAATRQAQLAVEQPREQAERELAAALGDEFAAAAIAHHASLVDAPERATGDVQRVLGRPARTFAEWAETNATAYTRLSTAQVARSYADAFRAGDVGRALALLDADVVRVAPLENGGEAVEVRGLAAIQENAERINADGELRGVAVGEPLLGEDRFALQFSFAEADVATGQQWTTTKTSVCTVAGSRIVREEVHYFTPVRPEPVRSV